MNYKIQEIEQVSLPLIKSSSEAVLIDICPDNTQESVEKGQGG